MKSWFQYRCQRKFVYETMDKTARTAIPILEDEASGAWAAFGIDYEERVVQALIADPQVSLLAPPPGERCLSEAASLGFLKDGIPYNAACQLQINATPALHAYLGLGPDLVSFSRGIVDVLLARQEGARRVFRLVDIKSTHLALPFHKMQLAWYAWMLRSVLQDNSISAEIDPLGEIWHRSPQVEAGEAVYFPTAFRLRSYESVIKDWASRELGQALTRQVSPARDDTEFHIYFKCEQCAFLPHCLLAIDDSLPRERWDLSAVAGMSHQTKTVLKQRGIKDLGALWASRHDILHGRLEDWKLSTQGRRLVARAGALLDGRARLRPGQVTLRMPPLSHTKVFLVADRDPLADRLAALGILVTRGGEKVAQEIALVKNAGEEGRALAGVLRVLLEQLRAAHQANQTGAHEILHIFVYEPAESVDLAQALGRRLARPDLLKGALDLLRLFPPDAVLPEPEYHGYHHLPASSLRRVLEEIAVLPAKVSYDLARVCQAMSRLQPAPQHLYVPGRLFARPFSARLNLSVCREMAEGHISGREVRADVQARLWAMQGLTQWLEAANQQLPPDQRFLRLNKASFRLHRDFDPLATGALDMLRARALLENRVSLLKALHRLAQPLEIRRSRGLCLAGLELLEVRPGRRGGCQLLLRIPPEARENELLRDDDALLLSDGHPDHLLDPALWKSLAAKIATPQAGDDYELLRLRLSREVWESALMQRLQRETAPESWVLDRGFADVNTERLCGFLAHLDKAVS